MENAGFSFSAPAASPSKLLQHSRSSNSPARDEAWSIKAAGPTRIPGPPGTPADQKVQKQVRAVAVCRHLPPPPATRQRLLATRALPPAPPLTGRPDHPNGHPSGRGPARGEAAEDGG